MAMKSIRAAKVTRVMVLSRCNGELPDPAGLWWNFFQWYRPGLVKIFPGENFLLYGIFSVHRHKGNYLDWGLNYLPKDFWDLHTTTLISILKSLILASKLSWYNNLINFVINLLFTNFFPQNLLPWEYNR